MLIIIPNKLKSINIQLHNVLKIKKKAAAALLLLLVFTITTAGPPGLISLKTVSAEPSYPIIASQSAVLLEFSRGEIIFSQEGDLPMSPASLTKIMTLLIAYEALERGNVKLEDEVTVSERAWETGGSQMFLNIDQKVTFEELLMGIAIISANDACVAVSEYLFGLEASFVQEMNKKARELNLHNTKFENSSGLPHPDHYSSAKDMAKLAEHLLKKYPQVLELYSQKEFSFNDIVQANRNPLLGRYPGADGLKTGYTIEAGYCLAATAQQNGMRFIAIIFNAPSETMRRNDGEALLNYAFRNYCLVEFFSAGDIVSEIEIAKGEKRIAQLQAAHDIQVVAPYNRQEDLELTIISQEIITSPVTQGTPAGTAIISLDGKVLAEETLLIAEDIPKAGILSLLLRSIGGFFSSLWQQVKQKVIDILPGGKKDAEEETAKLSPIISYSKK